MNRRTNKIQTNMTISVWFKWNWNSSTKQNWIVTKSYNTQSYYSDIYYYISTHSNDKYLMAWFGSWNSYAVYPASRWDGTWVVHWPVTDTNVWYNVILTNDVDTKMVYINWQLFSTSTIASTTTTTSIDTRIWWFVPRNDSWYFNWNISNVIFENKTWTATEVSNYYNNTKSNYWL